MLGKFIYFFFLVSIPRHYCFAESQNIAVPLRDLEQVSVRVPSVRFFATGEGPKKGTFTVETLRGGPLCQIDATSIDGKLDIQEKLKDETQSTKSNKDADCLYEIHLTLPDAVEMNIESNKFAQLELENWDDSIKVKVSKGVVAFSHIGELAVDCKQCDLSGEYLEGALKYSIEAGSVGVSQLSSSVDGNSKGDVVLSWRRVRPDAKVHVLTKAGDVLLSFPPAARLSLDLKAPKGDVFTKANSYSSGVPIVATAEAGTIRLAVPGQKAQ